MADEVGELRKRLDMAEDELTFLKAVFEEYKDSSGELEAELDAQLKDLERSNLALKRENEQIRAQLQSTVTRSRKSAEEASNLTTALEAHLEELTKREKKAQSRIRMLEQENEQLQKDGAAAATAAAAAATAAAAAAAPADEAAPVVAAPVVPTSNPVDLEELEKLRAERNDTNQEVSIIKTQVYDARTKIARLAALTEARFATEEVEVAIPDMPPEDSNDLESIKLDMEALVLLIGKAEKIMAETKMTSTLVSTVASMLVNGNSPADLNGESEHAINASCLTILGRIMVLGQNLPQFKRQVATMKATLGEKEQFDEKEAADLAHQVLMLAEEIMTAVFDPMGKKKQEEELKQVKADTVKMIEEARAEGHAIAAKEAESLLNKEKQAAEAQLAELQKAQSSTTVSLQEAQKEMERLKAESDMLLQSARTEAKQLAEQARREALEEANLNRKDMEEEIYQSVAAEMDALRQALEKSEGQYEQAAMQQEMYQNSMKNAIKDQSNAMLAAMKNARDELENLRRGTQVELADTQKLLNDNLNHVRKVARTIAKSDIATLSMSYERELDMRVKLQDQLQALRGNIRVYCRIRPLLGNELENGEVEAVTRTTEMTVTAQDPDNPDKASTFNFDRVFGPEDAQEPVFDELRTLCLSAMDGYNVCIFAYGITGSGKTFTVEGGERARENPKLHGLVYRTIKELFRIAYGERAGAYDTEISIQLMELYNDDFRDLLVDPSAKVAKPEVRIVPGQGVIVDNVTIEKVKNMSAALEMVKTGYRNRTTSKTDSNAVSSRSHSVLTLHLNGVNVRTKKNYSGKLHFVDLAGSERVGKSGVTGDALKEAQAINKSLSALGDVISALSKKEKFIPFRNSSLTKFLQESLGGNSKTVMISNISPCLHSMSETISSLKFATRVHAVEMGSAKKNENADVKEVKQIKNKLADIEAKFQSRGGKMRAPSTPRGKGINKSPRTAGSKRK